MLSTHHCEPFAAKQSIKKYAINLQQKEERNCFIFARLPIFILPLRPKLRKNLANGL
jgi:hypothetical protein